MNAVVAADGKLIRTTSVRIAASLAARLIIGAITLVGTANHCQSLFELGNQVGGRRRRFDSRIDVIARMSFGIATRVVRTALIVQAANAVQKRTATVDIRFRRFTTAGRIFPTVTPVRTLDFTFYCRNDRRRFQFVVVSRVHAHSPRFARVVVGTTVLHVRTADGKRQRTASVSRSRLAARIIGRTRRTVGTRNIISRDFRYLCSLRRSAALGIALPRARIARVAVGTTVHQIRTTDGVFQRTTAESRRRSATSDVVSFALLRAAGTYVIRHGMMILNQWNDALFFSILTARVIR